MDGRMRLPLVIRERSNVGDAQPLLRDPRGPEDRRRRRVIGSGPLAAGAAV